MNIGIPGFNSSNQAAHLNSINFKYGFNTPHLFGLVIHSKIQGFALNNFKDSSTAYTVEIDAVTLDLEFMKEWDDLS